MKRFHVHVAVDDLDASIRFYSTVFGAQPTVQKTDYAKWMMEDPRLNFALSKRGAKAGLDEDRIGNLLEFRLHKLGDRGSCQRGQPDHVGGRVGRDRGEQLCVSARLARAGG